MGLISWLSNEVSSIVLDGSGVIGLNGFCRKALDRFGVVDLDGLCFIGYDRLGIVGYYRLGVIGYDRQSVIGEDRFSVVGWDRIGIVGFDSLFCEGWDRGGIVRTGDIELDIVVLKLPVEDVNKGPRHLLNALAGAPRVLVIIVVRTLESAPEESVRGGQDNQKKDDELHFVLIFVDVFC